jgi:hypothetical protein
VESWRPQLVALLDLVRQPPEKIGNLTKGPEAAPGILVSINPFDYLVYQKAEDAVETAKHLVRNRVMDNGLFYFDRAQGTQKVATDDDILKYLDRASLLFELTTYIRQHTAEFPSDWLPDDVPEYDAHDMVGMSDAEVAAYKKKREDFIERAFQVARTKVESCGI